MPEVSVPRFPVRREIARVAVAIGAIAAVVTWPLLRQMTSALPGDLGDPVLNTFLLGWGAARMLGGFIGVWNAPTTSR